MKKFYLPLFLLFASALSGAEPVQDIIEAKQIASYLDGSPYMVMQNTQKSSITYLSDSDFASSIADGYSIVDFYADWCGPCKNLGPVFEKVSGELIDSLRFYKLNVDNGPKSSSVNNIDVIPTLIIFKDGKEVARRVGGCNESQLKAFIFTNIKS